MTGTQRVCAAALALIGLWAGGVAATVWGPAWHEAELNGVQVYREMIWPAERIVVLVVALALLASAAVFVVLAYRRGVRARADRLRPGLVVGLALGVCVGPIAGLLGFVLTMQVLGPEPDPSGA